MSQLDDLAAHAFLRAQADIKEFLHYNPHTGVFTWLKDGRRHKAGDQAKTKSKSGYLMIRLFNQRFPAHRLAWLYMYGRYPKLVDHINGDPSDNRIINLRECTPAENSRNRRKIANTASGRTGVCVTFPGGRPSGKWTAKITVDGEVINLGSFNNPNRAEGAYKLAARRYHKEFATPYSREELAPMNEPRQYGGQAKRIAQETQSLLVNRELKRRSATLRTT